MVHTPNPKNINYKNKKNIRNNFYKNLCETSSQIHPSIFNFQGMLIKKFKDRWVERKKIQDCWRLKQEHQNKNTSTITSSLPRVQIMLAHYPILKDTFQYHPKKEKGRKEDLCCGPKGGDMTSSIQPKKWDRVRWVLH